jgi:RDD family
MFCTQCGAPAAAGGKFCGKCGAVLQGTLTVTLPVTTTAEAGLGQRAAPRARPWVRYCARMFDILLFLFSGGILIGILASHVLERVNDLALGLFLVFVWVFIEALLLSMVGTTPGKWLCNVQLTLKSGATIPYSAALSRSLKVWWRGLGIGFPLVSLITLAIAHGELRRNSVTSWDKEGGFIVGHGKVGVGRALVAIFFLVVFVVLIAVGNRI